MYLFHNFAHLPLIASRDPRNYRCHVNSARTCENDDILTIENRLPASATEAAPTRTPMLHQSQ
jgi:hypothetical protein